MRTIVLGLLTTVLLSISPKAKPLACSPRFVTVNAKEVAPDAPIVVRGVNFYAACNDTAPLAKTPPAVGIRLLFIQGESRQEIGKTDANETLEFSATVNIPKDAKEGDAAIVAEITSRDVERSAPFKVISKK